MEIQNLGFTYSLFRFSLHSDHVTIISRYSYFNWIVSSASLMGTLIWVLGIYYYRNSLLIYNYICRLLLFFFWCEKCNEKRYSNTCRQTMLQWNIQHNNYCFVINYTFHGMKQTVTTAKIATWAHAPSQMEWWSCFNSLWDYH